MEGKKLPKKTIQEIFQEWKNMTFQIAYRASKAMDENKSTLTHLIVYFVSIVLFVLQL